MASLVLDRTATIGISGPFAAELDDLDRVSVGVLRMIPVAAAKHPLAAGPQQPGAAREQVQLVVTDRSPLTQGRDFSVGSSRTWRMADLSAKHALLCAGIGWGMMPQAMVRADIEAGVLRELDLSDLVPFDYPLDAIHRSDIAPGPAAKWLIERFRSQPSD